MAHCIETRSEGFADLFAFHFQQDATAAVVIGSGLKSQYTTCLATLYYHQTEP